MYYIYDTHLGEIQITQEERTWLHCDTCNDDDRFVGSAETKADVYNLIKDISYYTEDYISEVMNEYFNEDSYVINERIFFRVIFTSASFAHTMKRYLKQQFNDQWYLHDTENGSILFDIDSPKWTKCVEETFANLGCSNYYNWYISQESTYINEIDKDICFYLSCTLFDEYGYEC